MQIAYAGNFDPPHSTENEVRLTSESPITLEVTRKGAKIRTSWSR